MHVVSITAGGYAKRTKTDLYRVQNRGGKGVRGAQLRDGDYVKHLFPTTSHHWILFFTGRPGLPHQGVPAARGRTCKGGHVAGLLVPAGRADRPGVGDSRLRAGALSGRLACTALVKKTRLGDYNNPRQAGVIAINFRDDNDELIGAELVSS